MGINNDILIIAENWGNKKSPKGDFHSRTSCLKKIGLIRINS